MKVKASLAWAEVSAVAVAKADQYSNMKQAKAKLTKLNFRGLGKSDGIAQSTFKVSPEHKSIYKRTTQS